MGTRILLLLSVAWLAKLVSPLFIVMQHPVSGRDIVLLSGGLFLIYKAVKEITRAWKEAKSCTAQNIWQQTLLWVIAQIAVIDIVFSLDSVITAVGLAEHLWVMITAIVLAIGVMMVAAKTHR